MESNNQTNNQRESKFVTGATLLGMNVKEIPYLIKDLFPKYGLICLAGSSDAGKSFLLRQFAISVAMKHGSFLGFKIQSQHASVLYVSTEDDVYATAYLLNNTCNGTNPANLERLMFVFDTENLIEKIKEIVTTHPVDAICIDAFSDVFTGDMNSSNKVRTYLQEYKILVERFKCLVVFLHHTGKRTESLIPSKSNLNGSQGMEAKMRLVIEFRKDSNDNSLRHLCIVKGNYVKDEEKNKSYVLKFNNWNYENTGRRVAFQDLVPVSNKGYSEETVKKVYSLLDAGLTDRKVSAKLNGEGIKISKSTVNNLKRERPNVQKPLGDLDSGQLSKENEGLFDDFDPDQISADSEE